MKKISIVCRLSAQGPEATLHMIQVMCILYAGYALQVSMNMQPVGMPADMLVKISYSCNVLVNRKNQLID